MVSEPVAGTNTAQAATGLPGRARISLRQVLWGLVLAIALPILLVAAGGFYSGYRAEQQAVDQRMQETARALSLLLDSELDKSVLAMRVLARSPTLANGDFEGFYEAVKDAGLGAPSWIALFEPSGRAIFNTRVPYGVRLPDSNRPDVLRQVQETRKPHVSDLYTGSLTGQRLITIDVPVVIDETVVYILSLAITPEAFQNIIRDQRIVDGWNAAVLDRSKRIVARSRAPERFVGQLASANVQEALAASSEGLLQSVTLDGIAVRTYFSQSPAYGWSFVISIPTSELAQSIQRSLFWLMVLAGVAIGGLILAALLSRAIARPVDQLVAAAQVLGRREEVTGQDTTQVVEFDTIRTALAEASADIRRHEREREDVLAQIAESEARLRLALNAGHFGSWELTPETGVFITSANCRANFGRGRDEPFTYADLVSSIHPDDRAMQAEAVAQAIATNTDLHVEYRAIWPDESEHWIRVSGRKRIGANGQLSMVGVSQEITERKLADERQALLLRELNHRVKNTLATVQSVASLTRRSAENTDPAAWNAFMDRLHGLAKTHDLLTNTQWQGALLDDVLKNELDPYQDAMRQRIRLRGPRINLQPGAVLALGLAIHEMATNAVKYGSLSVPDGKVHVMWAITSGSAPPSLLVEWVESGGPTVKKPERQGFGTKLIQRGLAQQLGGEIKLDFAPTGVRCVITFPIATMVDDTDEVDDTRRRYAS
ncbi:two-component sensor histidine kinase/PAS domain-containing protein [Microvirga lupini]|uniref:Blue-light-activated histidine kinase n=1 Tax=Microvirga lupini TaxID=420324 RepID=A0A7W4VGY0_9HYPH|nr:HWE histidine kinase domain-containing protein [Microvirga lupini]MBB3016979.1 two-component sensor histidine kinase/PAS domain-containing protein [Microvirga lupini]